MIFSENVTTVTRTKVIREMFNLVNVGSPVTFSILANASEWDTGTKLEFPIKYAKSTDGGVTGIADQLDSSRQNNKTRLTFEPKAIYKPIVVADIEVRLNRGDERVLDLVMSESQSQTADLMDIFAEQVYSGTGTGNSWDSLSSAADDGTNYPTYGGLSRTTYPALDGYYLASAGSLTLGKLATAFDATERGTQSATMISTTKSLWSVYETLLTPTVRANYTSLGYAKMTAEGMVSGGQALSGTQGYDALTYRGKAFVKDEKCPSGNLFFINDARVGMERAFGFSAIDMSEEKTWDKVNFRMPEGTPKGVFGFRTAPKGFNFRDMMSPVDQWAKVGYVALFGDVVSPLPDLQGRMTGVTA